MKNIKTELSSILGISFKNSQNLDETKIIYVYRYLSWGLTSAVYLTGKPYSLIYFKLGVIISLFITSKIITDLYIKYRKEIKILRLLVLVEILGIAVLLLPTGGLNSPFIWYALNPTIVAASYLPIYFCWMNLVFYLLSGTVMTYILFNSTNLTMVKIFTNNINLVLVFILITLAVQLLASLAKKILQINNALTLSNIQKEESMEHIMSLYQVIEALNNHCNKDKLFKVLSEYTAKLTKSELSFFWLFEKDKRKLKISRDLSIEDKNTIILELEKLNIRDFESKKIKEIRLSHKEFLIIPILSTTTYFGIIAIQKNSRLSTDELNQYTKLLEFLAELSAVTLERFSLEDMEDHLLVIEEQNRIANEMHDTVSQRLFSISYAIHGVLGRWEDMSKDQLKEYLKEIQESSNLTMQELRNSIYKLSSKKKGEKSLQISLKGFLDNLSKLHNIIIHFDVKGDEGWLSLELNKALTRIVREACSNAVRHGECRKIHLDLVIQKKFLSLSIVDDGKGFLNHNNDISNQKGLGISNIKNLVYGFNGTIKVISELNRGTEIQIMIPNEGVIGVQHQEGGIAI